MTSVTVFDGALVARNPRVLIVDEPTRGIDIGAKAELHALLARLGPTKVPVLSNPQSGVAEVRRALAAL